MDANTGQAGVVSAKHEMEAHYPAGSLVASGQDQTRQRTELVVKTAKVAQCHIGNFALQHAIIG